MPQVVAAAAQADLLKQQEELERKAAELDRREQQLQSRQASSGQVTSLVVTRQPNSCCRSLIEKDSSTLTVGGCKTLQRAANCLL